MNCGYMKTNNELFKYAKNNTSQVGEDGIIEEILKRLNITSGDVLDIGASDGKWNSNTFTLLQRGFNVYAIEKSKSADKMFVLKETYNNLYPIKIGLTKEKESDNHINKVLDMLKVPKDLVFMSLDIDSIDPWVLQDIDRKPIFFCCEIEPRYYPLDMIWHNPIGNKDTNPPQNLTGFGPMYKIAKEKGYTLICTTIQNLFFLRNDMLKALNSPEVTDVDDLTNFNPKYLSPDNKKRWLAYERN